MSCKAIAEWDKKVVKIPNLLLNAHQMSHLWGGGFEIFCFVLASDLIN